MKYFFSILAIVFISTTSFSQDISKCAKKLNIEIDKFTGIKTISTPVAFSIYGLNMLKTINEGKETYVALLSVSGSTLNVKEKGVIVLFKDGTKIEKPEVGIDVNPLGGNWQYSTAFYLDDEELNLFATKEIDAIRLYIYDAVIPKKQSENFKCQTAALRMAK